MHIIHIVDYVINTFFAGVQMQISQPIQTLGAKYFHTHTTLEQIPQVKVG